MHFINSSQEFGSSKVNSTIPTTNILVGVVARTIRVVVVALSVDMD